MTHMVSTPIHSSAHQPWPWGLWVRWVAANALAEIVGLGLSMLFFAFGMPLTATLGIVGSVLLVVAGSTLVEGTAVGIMQWLVLRRVFPHIRLFAWWAATTAGALIAWVLGMLPSTLMAVTQVGAETATSPQIDDALIYVLAALMGAVLGAILGGAQWWVLRRHIAHAGWWVPANSLAWMAGMVIIFATMGSIPVDGAWPQIGVIAATGLGLAGAAVGAIHGSALVYLERMPRGLK